MSGASAVNSDYSKIQAAIGPDNPAVALRTESDTADSKARCAYSRISQEFSPGLSLFPLIFHFIQVRLGFKCRKMVYR
jgi:hypothetical protein